MNGRIVVMMKDFGVIVWKYFSLIVIGVIRIFIFNSYLIIRIFLSLEENYV